MKLVKQFVCLSLTGFFITVSLAPRAFADTYYSPHPERQFTTIGSDGEQFTDDQFNKLATNKGIVILNKAMSIPARYEATRELVKRNSSIKVLVYINTKIWYESNKATWRETGYDPVASFCNCWLLKDNQGNPIPQRKDGEEQDKAYMIDLSNADYRNWALGVLQRWLSTAPFAGIHFDAGNDYADGYDGRNWTKALGQDKLNAVNAGMRDLQTRAKQLPGAKIVTFNGFTVSDYNGPDRGTSKLSYVDGGTEEGYCSAGNTTKLDEDRGIMTTFSNKFILMHNHYKIADSPDAPRVLRFCLANFLMGWQPGYTYINSVRVGSYGVTTLDYHLPELDLNHGNPAGPAQQSGSVLSRQFTNGYVYVNNGDESATITLPVAVTRMEDGPKETFAAGTKYTLASKNGAFFFSQESTTSTGAANSKPNVPALDSLGDVGAATVHEFASPTDINDIYDKASNKLLFWLTMFIYTAVITGISAVLIYVADRHGLLNPLKFAYGKVKNKLFPPMWDDPSQ